jgi:myo-inositol 2-dehydrogenase / D-chiro-inositol 1-dehydrogenase
VEINNTTRRNFIKSGSAAAVAVSTIGTGTLANSRGFHAQGSDLIRIGLVGCGGRGTGAAVQALNTTSGPVQLRAIGDVFQDRVDVCLKSVKNVHSDKVDVPAERQFVGFDAYSKVINSDIDLVILATPPGFRPLHFEEAVRANKHVFMEKPVATDGPGIRSVLETTREAQMKNLAVAVGLQRHHEKRYQETIARLHDGAIGDINLLRVYWNGAGVWVRPRSKDQTELEYQMRNWYYFNWICGDHIVEQHIHNLDVGNWVMNDYPIEANAMGGREVRKGNNHGQIFDHHFVEFTYKNGTKMFSQCRHIENCYDEVAEFAHGSKGTAKIAGASIADSNGKEIWSFGRGGGNGHQEEHHDLFADLRKGRIPNEGEYGAKSTLTAILGRMASYTGKVISWDQAMNSKLALANFGGLTSMKDEAPLYPDETGHYDVPVPGSSWDSVL